MMRASGQYALRAEQEYGRYQIKCSTGESIPLGAGGLPLSAVVLQFYSLTAEGVMAAFTAPQFYYKLLDERGGTLYDDGLSNEATYDITGDFGYVSEEYSSRVASVYVEIRDGNGSLLAVQTFSTVSDGQDAAAYSITLNVGEVVTCTADAELKAPDGLSVSCLLNGRKVIGVKFTTDFLDEAGEKIATGGVALAGVFNMCVNTEKKAPDKLHVKAYGDAGADAPYAEKVFSVVYDAPVPRVVKETSWLFTKSYANGDILILSESEVYMWNYPVKGNSTVWPGTDIEQNPETTHWRAFSYFEMVATRIMLAQYALVKNLGVENVEIGESGSIVMKDKKGNVLFEVRGGNVVCKTGTFDNVTVNGIIHPSLSYSSVKKLVDPDGDYTIDPEKEAFNTLFITTSHDCWVTLPDAISYEGLEMNIYQSAVSRMGLSGVFIRTANSSQQIYYSTSTALVGGVVVQTVSAEAIHYSSLKIIPNVLVKLVAVDGNWYVISGAVTGE